MTNKLNTLALAMLVGFANIAESGEPPTVPGRYENGPGHIQLSTTDLSTNERSAYALFEGVMAATQGLVAATSCSSAAGIYKFNVSADMTTGDSAVNEITVISPGNKSDALVLRATLNSQSEFRGLQLSVEQFGNGSLNSNEITKFLSTAFFNEEGTLMTLESSVNVRGINGRADSFQSKVIKDFYITLDPNDHHLYDWGLQEVSKLNFPIEKYWQRSKSQRDKGGVVRTIFVKDRLTGSSPCRIIMDGSGSNSQKSFAQSGTLIVSKETPIVPIPAFETF